jgi:hypothetical protein
MTKERRLAIEMWQAIREKLCNGELQSNLDLHKAKLDWLRAHNIDWYSECWFCHYFRQVADSEYYEGSTKSRSFKCPLNCNHSDPCDGYCPQYRIAHCSKNPLAQRLAAVDNIINALKGEYKE